MQTTFKNTHKPVIKIPKDEKKRVKKVFCLFALFNFNNAYTINKQLIANFISYAS